MCAHFSSLQDAVRANILALNHQPAAIELIDDYILNCTKDNIEQNRNRFFVKGDPKAVLLIEIIRPTVEEIEQTAAAIQKDMTSAGLRLLISPSTPVQVNLQGMGAPKSRPGCAS